MVSNIESKYDEFLEAASESVEKARGIIQGKETYSQEEAYVLATISTSYALIAGTEELFREMIKSLDEFLGGRDE